MKALVEIRDWEGLETFAKSKKSPIGYEPFVTTIIASGAQRQAISFVPRCDPRNRIEMFVKCGEWIMAGAEAVRTSDRNALMDLKQRSPNSIIAAQLDQLLEDLHNSGA